MVAFDRLSSLVNSPASVLPYANHCPPAAQGLLLVLFNCYMPLPSNSLELNAKGVQAAAGHPI